MHRIYYSLYVYYTTFLTHTGYYFFISCFPERKQPPGFPGGCLPKTYPVHYPSSPVVSLGTDASLGPGWQFFSSCALTGPFLRRPHRRCRPGPEALCCHPRQSPGTPFSRPHKTEARRKKLCQTPQKQLTDKSQSLSSKTEFPKIFFPYSFIRWIRNNTCKIVKAPF